VTKTIELAIKVDVESPEGVTIDKASIAHALMHLETNKIADDDYPGYGGWYCGDREQFVKRHKKAVALMRSLLAPNVGIERQTMPQEGRSK